MNAAHSLKHYLSEWQSWGLTHLGQALSQQPKYCRPLTQGKSNDSFLIQGHFNDQASHYVLRLNQTNNLYNVDRIKENTVQVATNKLGISPAIIYQAPNHRYRVSEYIEGETLATQKDLTEHQIHALCDTIERYQNIPIHSLFTTSKPFSYSKTLAHYWHTAKQLATTDTEDRQLQIDCDKNEQYTQAIQQAEHYESQHQRSTRVLCHHDLNPNNIIIPTTNATQRHNKTKKNPLILLDWEFAGAGIRSMDYAIVMVELRIDSATITAITDIEAEELDIAANIYRNLCELYSHANTLPTRSET